MAKKEEYLPVLAVGIIALFALAFLFQQGGKNDHNLLGFVIGKTKMETLEHPIMLSVRPPCQENDRGYDWFVTGTTSYDGAGYKPKTDYCVRKLVLKEYYCHNNRVRSASVLCPVGYSCNDGACIPDDKDYYLTKSSDYYGRIKKAEEIKKAQTA